MSDIFWFGKEERDQQLRELSQKMGITILDVAVYKVLRGPVRKRYYRWEIETDRGTVRVTGPQMVYPRGRGFRKACAQQILFLPIKPAYGQWFHNILKGLMAVAKRRRTL
jgi:hypothetical protein